jgi:hypothetical protein
MYKMKNLAIAVFVLAFFQVNAQEFEGLVKYSIDMKFSDPKKQAMVEESRKEDSQRAKSNSNQPQIQEEAMIMQDTARGAKGGAPRQKSPGEQSRFPTALNIRVKNGNNLSKMVGGRNDETLYLKAQDKAYDIDNARKAYSEVRKPDSVKALTPPFTTPFQETSERVKIKDYECQKYTRTFMAKDVQVTQDVWVTHDISGLDLKVLSKQRLGKYFVPVDKIEGVPIKIVSKDSEMSYTLDLKEIKRLPIPEKSLSLPKDYKSLTPSGKTAEEKMKEAKEKGEKKKKAGH